MVDDDGNPLYADYADYDQAWRKPGIGLWPGFAAKMGLAAEPHPDQVQQYIENGGFWSEELPENAFL